MNKAFTEEQLTNIREALKGWEKLTFDQINASSGFGLCNFTYVVKALDPEVQPPTVFYREFGDMMGAKDHEEENQIFKAIAKTGLGPQCYYANNRYRIEEYIPSKVLRPNEANTPIISNSVAKWLAGLHKQNFDFLGLDKTRTVTLDKIDSQNLIKKAKEVLDTTTFTGEDKEITDLLKNKVTEEELNSLKEMLPKSDKAIAFCHNDPNLGNIIKAEGTGEVIVVDYENCGYNYRGVDIGAYFTLCRVDLAYPEPPYINVDYTKFSTDEEMKAFIRRYLLFFRYDWSTIDQEKALVDDEYLKKYVTKHDNLEDFEAEVDEILRESFIGAMICQMNATVAVVVMDLKLPYSKYEMCRASYKSYMEFKAKAKAAPVKA